MTRPATSATPGGRSVPAAGTTTLFALGTLLASCDAAPDGPPRPERTDSAGVEIVLNTAPERPLNWTFQPDVVIGGADEGPESFFQVADASLDVGPDGTLYLMDAGNKRLRAFAPDGTHLWSAGGQGQGPGEFMFAFQPSAAPDEVVVMDVGRRAFIRYGADGEFVGETPFEGLGSGIGTEIDFLSSGATLLKTRTDVDSLEVRRHRLSLIRGADTIQLLEADASRPEAGRVEACGQQVVIRGEPIFLAEYRWTHGGDQVAVSWGWPEYRIDLFSADGRRTSVRRAVTLREADEELALREVGEGPSLSFGAGSCDIDPANWLEARGWTTPVPAVADLRLTPGGELWVKREVVGGIDEPAPLDVFNPDGAYLGTLPAGTPFPAAFLPDGRPVTVEEDELEVPRIIVYSVERDGATD